MRYFIAMLILICPKLAERAKMVALWIQVANELRATFGDLYSFSSVMSALNCPQVFTILNQSGLVKYCVVWSGRDQMRNHGHF
jgi:hypothetical protein